MLDVDGEGPVDRTEGVESMKAGDATAEQMQDRFWRYSYYAIYNHNARRNDTFTVSARMRGAK